jgi:hypothetical protein
MKTKTHITSFASMLFLFVTGAFADDLVREYAELDALLAKRSAKYKSMAEVVRQRQPYRIVPHTDFPLGNVRE